MGDLENPSSVHDRINEIATDNALNVKELSEALSISYRTVQNYMADRNLPGGDFLIAMSEVFGVSSTWMLTGKGSKWVLEASGSGESDPEFVPIPKFTVSASAGNGVENVAEEAVGHYAFDRRWLRQRGLKPDRLAIITVSGDSMEPKLRNHDIILVDLDQRSASDGKTYVIRIGDELLVKHIQRISPSQIDLISANPTYPPRTVDLSKERDSIQIIGKVVASMQDW